MLLGWLLQPFFVNIFTFLSIRKKKEENGRVLPHSLKKDLAYFYGSLFDNVRDESVKPIASKLVLVSLSDEGLLKSLTSCVCGKRFMLELGSCSLCLGLQWSKSLSCIKFTERSWIYLLFSLLVLFLWYFPSTNFSTPSINISFISIHNNNNYSRALQDDAMPWHK